MHKHTHLVLLEMYLLTVLALLLQGLVWEFPPQLYPAEITQHCLCCPAQWWLAAAETQDVCRMNFLGPRSFVWLKAAGMTVGSDDGTVAFWFFSYVVIEAALDHQSSVALCCTTLCPSKAVLVRKSPCGSSSKFSLTAGKKELCTVRLPLNCN